MEPTPTRRLARVLLGQPVEQWIRDRRTAGKSWRRIALELRDTTNGQIDVTHETVRAWAAITEHAA